MWGQKEENAHTPLTAEMKMSLDSLPMLQISKKKSRNTSGFWLNDRYHCLVAKIVNKWEMCRPHRIFRTFKGKVWKGVKRCTVTADPAQGQG